MGGWSPCGLHVHLCGLVCPAECKDPLEGILPEAHVDVHLAPVLLDVICSLSDASVQGNIGEELKTSKFLSYPLTYIKPGVLRLTLKIQIYERFEHSLVGDFIKGQVS